MLNKFQNKFELLRNLMFCYVKIIKKIKINYGTMFTYFLLNFNGSVKDVIGLNQRCCLVNE